MNIQNRFLLFPLAVASFLFITSCERDKEGNSNPENSSKTVNVGASKNKWSFSKPYQSSNLQIFMISGEAQLENRKYVTLTKALEEEKVEIVETSDVNELSVNNNSDEFIFIQSGDVVKGGKQDRTIQHDVILPPNTEELPLASFCVESGRWSKRGLETDDKFSSNTTMLSSKKLKIASKYNGDQNRVWANVEQEQSKLNSSMSMANGYAVDVRSDASASSLQLTLENDELTKMKNEIKTAFANLLQENPNSVGFAYAIKWRSIRH